MLKILLKHYSQINKIKEVSNQIQNLLSIVFLFLSINVSNAKLEYRNDSNVGIEKVSGDTIADPPVETKLAPLLV